MSISAIGAMTILATLICAVWSPTNLAWVLSATVAFPRTAAITFGGNAVPPFYVVALAATLFAMASWVRGDRPIRARWFALLGGFVSWALLVTAVAPALFAGVATLDPRSSIDQQVLDPTPLDYHINMAAQLVYLILAAGVVVFIAQRSRLSAGLLTPGLAIGTFFSAARLFPGAPAIIDPIFRDYGDFVFNPYEKRQYGIFVEPSVLATFSIATVAYCLYRVVQVRGARIFGLISLGVTAALNLALSSSGTAAAAAVILVGGVLAYYCGAFLLGRRTIRPLALLVPLILTLVLITPNPIANRISTVVADKLGSQSFDSRSTSDMFSLAMTRETWGLGAGLGSNRPSSFFTFVLSNVGLVGLILLIAFFLSVIPSALRLRMWRPTGAALLALVVAKVVAEPDLSSPLLWLSAGICCYAATNHARSTWADRGVTSEATTFGHSLRRLESNVGSAYRRTSVQSRRTEQVGEQTGLVDQLDRNRAVGP